MNACISLAPVRGLLKVRQEKPPQLPIIRRYVNPPPALPRFTKGRLRPARASRAFDCDVPVSRYPQGAATCRYTPFSENCVSPENSLEGWRVETSQIGTSRVAGRIGLSVRVCSL